MNSRRILSFLLLGIFFLACENEQQTWLSEMEGKISCGVPDVVGINQPVTFTAVGISTPGNVAYTWKAPDFSPTTFTGVSFEAVAPDIAGEYFISITAKSAGYRDVTYQQKVVVVLCIPMQGQLDIVAPADVAINEEVSFTAMGITTPTAVTYRWAAPGFSPNTYTGGNEFKPHAPAAAGTYEITVTATAENYCDTSIKKTIQVIQGRKMQGLFSFEPTEAIKGQRITFTAQGINTPRPEYLSYKWTLNSKFTNVTEGGNTCTATCPTDAGFYNVSVTAKATTGNYLDSTITRQITVSDEQSMIGGILSITALSDEIVIQQPATFTVNHNIIPPAGGISFTWNAPAFSPNSHQTTGNTFAATPITVGTYPVTVTAKAEAYRAMTYTIDVTVKGERSMSGTIDFTHVPNQVVKDLPATFTVVNNGLNAGGTPITYTWTATGFSPDTFEGPTFIGVPTISGQIPVKVEAKADGYTSKEKSKTVDVIGGQDMGTLTIVANGTSPFPAGTNTVIFTPEFTTPPPPGVTYTWNATNCTPNTFTGAEYKPTLPSVAGNYTIKLIASATGYNPKQATFNYEVKCNPMNVSFNLTDSKLLTNDETTLTVNPPTAPTSGVSYEWTVPTGFGITDGSSITPSVTVKAPTTALANPATITLTAKAENYCDASYSDTVTVKDCYPSTYTPVINSSATFEGGIFHASNLQNVTFSTSPVTPLRSGGTTTYAWSFAAPPSSSSRSFTPSSSPATTDNTTFITKAPGHSTDIHNLTLQVVADGYCSFDPVSKPVVVDPSKGALTGTIEISEVIAPTSDFTKPVLWIAKNRPITLHAHYSAGSGEAIAELDLVFKWYWVNGNSSTFLGENDGTLLDYIPLTAFDDNRIRVEVHDRNGKASTGQNYPFYVQDCVYSGPDLHVNVNWRCGTTAAFDPKVYIKDAADDKIYQVVRIKDRWWFGENLKRAAGNYIPFSSSTLTGFFYERNNSTLDDMHDPTKGAPCPVGWKIPNTSDWTNLELIDESNSPSKRFKWLANNKITTDPNNLDGALWVAYNNRPYENRYEFSALPGGYISNNMLSLQGRAAYFMTYGSDVWYLGSTSGASPNSIDGTLSKITAAEGDYYNIRCVRDYP
jgi:uncharacterized protein (TIGR02145 family)